MAVGFIRRFTFDPGLEEITAIEGVVVIDREPPASLSGVGTGTACVVGEFENGPFELVTEVASGGDLLTTFGGFGYTYDGVQSNNPTARQRQSDGAAVPEYWNGNGFISLVNKQFRRLLIMRVDTSVGEVTFSRLASISGAPDFTFNLEPAQTVVVDLGAGGVTATFNAAAATVDSVAGTYPSTFVGGESITFAIDGTQYTAFFLAADQTQAQVVDRLNAAAGTAAFTLQGGGVTRLNGRQRGTGGSVQIVSVSSVLVTTATGFSAGVPVLGTGNVANIDQVTATEANTVISAAITGTRVDRDQASNIRITNTGAPSGGSIMVLPATTATAFGWTTGQVASLPNGYAVITGGTMPVPTGFAGGETVTLGIDDEPNVVVTFAAGDQTTADVITKINAAFGFTFATLPAANKLRLTGRKNGGQVRVVAASSPTVLTELGLVVGATNAFVNVSGTIPAGTRVRNATGIEWVTMQDVAVPATSPPTLTARVRPALDNGTTASALAGAVTVFPFPIGLGSFSVVNLMPFAAALTEAQLDAKYTAAIARTIDVSGVGKQINLIWSARSSNAIRTTLRTNAVDASANGCFGRMAIIRPPLKTTRAQAKSNVAQPGVGAYRDQRVVYAFPGAQTFVPQIALRGLSGGAGFTADGLIDTGFDSWGVSLLSQLPPEENPGQKTTFLNGITGIEAGNPDVHGMTINDYKAFRASGIFALNIDGGDVFAQSGITSVDPSQTPNLKNIARRRMADFIQDTLSNRLVSFVKQLSTRLRRALVIAEIDAFMRGLVSRDNPQLQRIDGYLLDGKTANTPESLAVGVFRVILKVRTLSSLDVIVLDTTVGESVEIDEQLAA